MGDTMAADGSNWCLPGDIQRDGVKYPGLAGMEEALDKIAAGDAIDYDVLVATFPRSGTARLVEVTWLLMHDCDVTAAGAVDINERHAFLETMYGPDKTNKSYDMPVVMKTHVNYHIAQKLVSRQKKVIVGMRNPKDVLVSLYHFHRMNAALGLFPGSWHQFFEFYKKGETIYGDYFDNVLSWWEQRGRDNVMVVRYEDLNENPLAVIKQMAAFLGQDHSEEKLQAVAEWTSFTSMKSNPTTNYASGEMLRVLRADISTYMRKGSVGDWVSYFSEEESAYMDGLCDSRCKSVGLEFKFKSTCKF